LTATADERGEKSENATRALKAALGLADSDKRNIEQLRAELEYWRELEFISGQRQHFKPGLTDEMSHQDDEVAA
jgi:hypothetical protein